MGSQQSTLGNWWQTLKEDKTLMYGPQVAFYLSKGNKTVLVFGEEHNRLPECGKNQKSFTDLFKNLISGVNCDNIDVILELADEIYTKKSKDEIKDYIGRLLEVNKIHDLLTTYLDDYKGSKDCRIRLRYSNPSKLNSNVYRYIERLRKNLLVTPDFVFGIQSSFPDLLDISKRIVRLYCELLGDRCDKIIYGTIIDKVFNAYETQALKRLNQLSSRSSVQETQEVLAEFYSIALHLMDTLTIILILHSEQNSILVYQGTMHSIHIVAHLLGLGYKLEDIGLSESLHCVQFTDKITLREGLKSVEDEMERTARSLNESVDPKVSNNLPIIRKYVEDLGM